MPRTVLLAPSYSPGALEVRIHGLHCGVTPIEGLDAIYVCVDRLTKMAHFIPTKTTITAEGTARLFYQHVWKHHGLPTTLSQIGGHNLSPSSPASCWNVLASKGIAPPRFIPGLMVKQRGLIRR